MRRSARNSAPRGGMGGEPVPLNNVVEHWMEVPVKMLGDWLDSDLQVEKNWVEGTSKIIAPIQTFFMKSVIAVRKCGGDVGVSCTRYHLPFVRRALC